MRSVSVDIVGVFAPKPSPTPTLRWIYAKHQKRLMCELSLDASDSVYELRTLDLDAHANVRIERFADVTPAFLRQDHIEGRLLANGWRLDLFERQPTVLS
jgi:hypothetical protein